MKVKKFDDDLNRRAVIELNFLRFQNLLQKLFSVWFLFIDNPLDLQSPNRDREIFGSFSTKSVDLSIWLLFIHCILIVVPITVA